MKLISNFSVQRFYRESCRLSNFDWALRIYFRVFPMFFMSNNEINRKYFVSLIFGATNIVLRLQTNCFVVVGTWQASRHVIKIISYRELITRSKLEKSGIIFDCNRGKSHVMKARRKTTHGTITVESTCRQKQLCCVNYCAIINIWTV